MRNKIILTKSLFELFQGLDKLNEELGILKKKKIFKFTFTLTFSDIIRKLHTFLANQFM